MLVDSTDDDAGDHDRSEREEFLAGVHVGVLAIDEPGRGPLAVPIWYRYEGGEVFAHVQDGSVKAVLLRAAGRATLVVQTETPPYKYVSVEGPVSLDAGPHDEVAMATRYLGPELGQVVRREHRRRRGRRWSCASCRSTGARTTSRSCSSRRGRDE